MMANNIAGFLTSFLLKLKQYRKNLPLPDLLIKLSIIHSRVLERRDLNGEIVEISGNILGNWERL